MRNRLATRCSMSTQPLTVGFGGVCLPRSLRGMGARGRLGVAA